METEKKRGNDSQFFVPCTFSLSLCPVFQSFFFISLEWRDGEKLFFICAGTKKCTPPKSISNSSSPGPFSGDPLISSSNKNSKLFFLSRRNENKMLFLCNPDTFSAERKRPTWAKNFKMLPPKKWKKTQRKFPSLFFAVSLLPFLLLLVWTVKGYEERRKKKEKWWTRGWCPWDDDDALSLSLSLHPLLFPHFWFSTLPRGLYSTNGLASVA